MRPYLDKEQERDARERADVLEGMLGVFVIALLLVGAFCFWMIFTSPA